MSGSPPIAMIDVTEALITILDAATSDRVKVIQANRWGDAPTTTDRYDGVIAVDFASGIREATYPRGTINFTASCYGIEGYDLEGYVSMDIARTLENAAYQFNTGRVRGPRQVGDFYCQQITMGLPNGPRTEPDSTRYVTLVTGILKVALRPVSHYTGGAIIN